MDRTPSRPSTRNSGDLYSQLFNAPGVPGGRRPDPQPTTQTHLNPGTAPSPGVPGQIAAPVAPVSLAASGLPLMQICHLVLKQLYLQGAALGIDLARQLRLPFPVVDEALLFLKDERLLEVSSGELLGRPSYRFSLGEQGRVRAKDAFEQCRYVGPAPVSLEAYVRQCSLQTVTGVDCDAKSLTAAFHDLVMRPGLLNELGPAVCSGRSIFIHGPPGNGKTLVAKGLGRFLNRFGGEIYVPYALLAENSIITLFDPTLHTATDTDEPAVPTGPVTERSRLLNENPIDLRWRKIRRPVIITGGELNLEMLDLRYSATGNFYQAPLHIKANGGVFLIDDFGRQIVSPRELLNRWIVPLEERIDYLSLATGKKFALPFEQLTIFSTNLDPRELVDEAFLRRIRHKIAIDTPDRALFTEIFRFSCQQRHIAFHQGAVDYLYTSYYDYGKPPRSSDARDLLEIIQSICRFRRQDVVLSEELLAEATHQFFCQT